MNRPAAWRVVLWIFGFVLLVLVVVPIWHSVRGHSTKDYWVWYQTGQTVLQGAEIYPDRWHKFPFMYPPPCALFLAPVAALGQTGLVVVLALVNAVAWICTIAFSVRLATGAWRGGHLLIYLVPSLIMGAHVWGNFLLGQPSLVLLALLLGAFIGMQGQRQWLSGGLIAIAAAIKAFPAIAIVYLFYRRYWIAIASLLLTLAFFLIVLPIPFRGAALAKQDLERWSSGMLFKYDETGVGQRLGRSTSWKNQSIWGVANRLLRHVEYDHKYEPHEPVYANFADLGFNAVNAIILACALALALGFIAVMPRSKARTTETDAIEFALLLLLILVFTPLSFGYLFAWAYALSVVLLLAYLVPYKACAFNTRYFLRALSAKDRLARAAVLFSQSIDTAEAIKKTAYPNDARPAIEGADSLDRLSLLRPPLVRTNRVDALPHEMADGKRASGSCESINPVAGNLVRASGWAALNAKGRPADAVLVAYQGAADQPWALCAISDAFSFRFEMVKRFGTMEQLWSGWSATFPQTAIPAGARLSFWAVDADEPRLYQLKDETAGTTR